jgi:magnesium transporter
MTTSPLPNVETAAQHLVDRIPIAFTEESIGSILDRLPGNAFDSLDAIYIVDEKSHLCGLVPLTDLLSMPREQRLGEVMMIEPPMVDPDDDQEEVASLAVQYGMASIPVVDRQGCLLGIVPAHALISILRKEHIEDLHRLAGIQRENSHARHALEDPPLRRAGDRLPWLLVGLLGSILATFVVSRFEQALEKQVFIAFFVPGIVYLADAIGTQTEAIVVRGLSLSQNSLRTLLMGELWTGLLIGLALGCLSFPLVAIAFGNIRIAIAVSLAILTAGGVATTIGLFLPWLFDRLGRDPAFGSGPVATIIQDVLSLLIYFAIVQWLLI